MGVIFVRIALTVPPVFLHMAPGFAVWKIKNGKKEGHYSVMANPNAANDANDANDV